MPVEGPIRELGLHDLFQLLGMSRKTGVLVVNGAYDAHATVCFEKGRVIHAGMRGRGDSAEEILLAAGRFSAADLDHARRLATPREGSVSALQVLTQAFAISPREVDRHVREHLESVVFDVLSWRDGHFSFEDRLPPDLPARTRARLSIESLLMESARRADEWARIADTVPHLAVVPTLAPVTAEPDTPLDLLPREWEVLTLVDGQRDVRAIANALSAPAFEVARLLHGLAGCGLVEVA